MKDILQWNRAPTYETMQLQSSDFYKDTENLCSRKTASSKKCSGKSEFQHAEKWKPCFSFCIMHNSKWTKDLIIKSGFLTLLEKKLGSVLNL